MVTEAWVVKDEAGRYRAIDNEWVARILDDAIMHSEEKRAAVVVERYARAGHPCRAVRITIEEHES